MTNESKHTPERWIARSVDDGEYLGDLPRGSWYVETTAHDVVCELDSCGVELPEIEERARLLAAAPALLSERDRLRAALEEIAGAPCACIEPDFPGESTIVCHGCIARAALAETVTR